MRNVPLLLQLFFWYFAIYGTLPRPDNQINFLGLSYLNNRGVYIPWPSSAKLALFGIATIIIGAVAAFYFVAMAYQPADWKPAPVARPS